MILVPLEHLPRQLAMNPRFQLAIDFLRREGWRGHSDGIIPIDAERVYGMLQSYETKIPGETIPFEGHRQFIDIQFVIDGAETIFWTPAARLTPTTPYDPAKDIWFCHAPRAEAATFILSGRQAAVFFPEDAHAPSHMLAQPMRVRKIVVKVAVED
jgi:YhcH/YjgK/YiaL family protein